MKLISQVGKFVDRLNYALYIVSGIIIFCLMFLVLADVILRQFNRPIVGAIEIVGVGLLYLTFLGAAWVLKKGGHVHMDLVVNYLSPRAKDLLMATINFIGILLWLAVAWFSARTTIEAYQNHFVWPGLLEIPKVVILPAIPVGCFLLAVESLKQTLNFIGSFIHAKPVAEGELAHQMD